MAKARATKTKTPAGSTTGDDRTRDAEPLDPKRVHELLGIHGPYEPPPPPVPTAGYVTWWDPGCSIQTLVAKHRALFYLKDFSGRFAKDTDSWKWRQIRLAPIEPGLPFEKQREQLKTGDEPAAARELVTFLIIRFLVTGDRLEMDRWRCKEVSEEGRRVIVGPFHPLGLDIASVSDTWKSPGICLSVMCTPVMKRK